LGFDARQLTPVLVQRMTRTAAETRSFARAALVMDEAVGVPVSAETIERVVQDVGQELAARRDADPRSDNALAPPCESPPQPAVVECDGGRIRTREPGHGPGVHRTGEGGWREDNNACLIRAPRTVSVEDPQPEPPESFRDPKHVAKIAATAAWSVAAVVPRGRAIDTGDDEPPLPPPPPAAWQPQRLVRTVLSDLAESKTFGGQMAREAKRRRFFEAKAKAFLGDGLPWNWSIWKKHFSASTPILDSIHVLSYPFLAAKAVHAVAQDAWDQDLTWMRGCWRGEVAQVMEGLGHWQTKLGSAPDGAAETDPRVIVAKTIPYLENNQPRMNYPEYRRQGLPVTTAWMESLVKAINYRVKGTEMFWNDPEGAEAILQVRAAALSDDDRLVDHLRTRPGCPFTRRPKASKPSAQEIKG
jgi:hypothetical protein